MAARKPKAPRLGECCKEFSHVIRRDVSKQARRGFAVETTFNMRTGKTMREVMLYSFPKGGTGEPKEERGVCLAVVKFCPFCGTPQDRKGARATPA